VLPDGGTSETGIDSDELLRTARTNRNKVIRFDAYPDGESPFTWFVAYRGKYGWSACRGNGEWMDEPTDDDVEHAVDKYDHVNLIDRSETPEGVTL
jgi:hypothetical protein